MTTESRIAALERRHRELDREIEAEMAHLSRDELLVADLKRRKLEVKDALTKQQRRVSA